MGGQHKKLQDFFSDNKVNRFDKNRAWLLVSATGEIAWIIGHRIDERFKVRKETQRVLALKFERNLGGK